MANAETCVFENNFDKALIYYQQAFEYFDIRNSEDAHNALLVALKTQNTDMSKSAALVLKEMGICDQYFEGMDFINNNSLISKALSTSKALNTNETYRQKLYELEAKDQAVRNPRDNKQAVRTVDSLNFISFLDFYERYGFPSDQTIGIQCAPNNKGIERRAWGILFEHFCLQGFEMASILKKALHDRYISPMEYACLYDLIPYKKRLRYHEQGEDCIVYRSTPIYQIGDQRYMNDPSFFTLHNIDSCRLTIGLPSVEEQIRRTETKSEVATIRPFRVQYAKIYLDDMDTTNLPPAFKKIE